MTARDDDEVFDAGKVLTNVTSLRRTIVVPEDEVNWPDVDDWDGGAVRKRRPKAPPPEEPPPTAKDKKFSRRGLGEAKPEEPPSQTIDGTSTRVAERELSPIVNAALAVGPRTLAELGGAFDPEARPQPVVEINHDIVLAPYMDPPEAMLRVNMKHAVVGNYGGKCMVLSWELWPVNRRQLVPEFQPPGDFKARYANKYVRLGPKDVEPVGLYWFASPGRLDFNGVDFAPGEPDLLPGNRLNLYRGFAVRPAKGSWKRMRTHIWRNLANNDPRAARYIIMWLAWCVQNPGKPAEAVISLRGEEGTGKTLLAEALAEFFGVGSLRISDPALLVGVFSGHLQHVVFLFLDEAFCASDKAMEGRLKDLITGKVITIHPKNMKPFQIRNCLHIILASNNDWVVPAGHGARRYAVFEVNEAVKDDFEYFGAIVDEMAAGGLEAMLHDLLALRLGDWHPRELYKTEALQEQKQQSLQGLDAWIEMLLQEGSLPQSKIMASAPPNRALSDDLLESAKAFGCEHVNKTMIAGKLKKLFGLDPDTDRFNIQILRGWALPPLPEARAAWERRYGPWPWHEPDLRSWCK